MPFHVMNLHRLNPQRKGQASPEGRPHQQGAKQAGPGRVGNPTDGGTPKPRIGKQPIHHRQQPADMIPRGQFRHDPAILGMNGLGMHTMTEQTILARIEGAGGFIA